jgi:microcystin-dependent protein
MDCYLGMVTTFAFNFAPVGFATCNGQILQIQQNSALYSLLGIAFGGNGAQTFGLPDLQGRAPVHCGVASGGSTNRQFAQKYGAESTALAATNLPQHTHTIGEKTAGQTVTATAATTINANDGFGTALKPTSNYWAKVASTPTTAIPGYLNSHNVTMASDAVTVTVTPTFNAGNLAIGNTGNGAAFALATPALPLNFCICTSGLYPTRS